MPVAPHTLLLYIPVGYRFLGAGCCLLLVKAVSAPASAIAPEAFVALAAASEYRSVSSYRHEL